MPRKLFLLLLLITVVGLTSCVHVKALRIRNQAEKLYKEGRTAEIIPLVEKTMAEMVEELGPDHRYVAECLNGLAVLYAYVLNDFSRAEEYFGRALEIREKTLGPEHPDTIQTINFLGFLYQVTGDYPKAEAFFKKALGLREKVLGPDHPDTADSQIFLSGLYINQGEYAKAETLLLNAKENEEHRVSTKYPSPADSLANLGVLYAMLGDYERSERYHREALAIRERELGPNHSIVAASLDSMGSMHQRRGDFKKAEDYYLRALRIKEKAFGRVHSFTGDSLLTIGIMHFVKKDHAQAAQYTRQALDIYEKLLDPDNPRPMIARVTLAMIHVVRKEFKEAKPHCLNALSSAQKNRVQEMLWTTQALYAMILTGQGNPNAAIFFGKQAVNTIQGLRAGISGMQGGVQKSYLVNKAFAYRLLAGLLIDQGRLPEAQKVLAMFKEEEYFDFIRRDSARKDVRATKADYTPVEEPWVTRYRGVNKRMAAIGREVQELRRKKKLGLSQAEEARLRRARENLRLAKKAFDRFLEELEAELQEVSRARAMEIGEKNLDKLKAMQGTLRELGNGAVLVHYLMGQDKLHLILTTTHVQLVRNAPIQAAELNRKILSFRQTLQRPDQDPRIQAQDLYQILIGPIAEDLRQAKARTLMLSLDGVLRYLPIAALHDGQHYVAEDYRIVIFTEAAQTKLNSRPAARWRMAGLGVTKGIAGFSALPNVKTELESIVRKEANDPDGVLPGVIYLDEAFTGDTVMDALDEGYPALHIASHFVFKPGTERDSYLLLGDGTTLSLAQMNDKDLDFNNVDLLTLSACETAMGGTKANGREIEGFGGFAQRQGAKAVLATLWPVADESTSLFMQNMYEMRQVKDLTKAEALQQAQIAFIRSKHYSHPFFWAPFILMGNWL